MGQDVPIEYVSNLRQKKNLLYGRWMDWEKKIEINSDAPWDQQDETILHEVVEGINSTLDLGMHHTQIQALARGLWLAGLRVGVA